MTSLHGLFQGREAAASCRLDGETSVLDGDTRSVPAREKPGYGCPHCGEVLRLDSAYVLKELTRSNSLPCCGYSPGDLELVRWLRAARLLQAGAAAHS